jgi:predicted CoA-binding protein
MIAKAGKGKTTVIIYTQDFRDKVHTFLTDNNFHPIPIDPTPKDQKAIQKTLQCCDSIIDIKHIKYLTQKSPTPPTLKALLKLHKPSIPIRPVVNNKNAPGHKAAKKVNTILNNCLHLDYQYNTTNSESLANELIKVKIGTNHILLTLDVEDLYVNIPIRETTHFTRAQILRNNDKRTTNQIIDLLETILKQNYFSFQGQIYQPDKGVAMGSPISGTMTEVFLQRLEKTIIKHLIDARDLSFHTRYKDDILINYDSMITNPDSILQYINNIHSNIQLNPTHETDNSINFLDLSITRKALSTASLPQ